MKKVNTQRFQEKKPENISFQASPLLEKPTTTVKNSPVQTEKKRPSESSSDLPNERTNERTVKKDSSNISKTADESEVVSGNFYTVEVPVERVKIRHSFDIFEDQKTALNKIQMAIMDAGFKKKPVLGDMIQEAIDLYIKEKSKRLNNLKINRERPSERTDERSETIDDINN